MAAILETAVSAKCAKIYIIGADRNALMSCAEAIIENPDIRQMRDVLVQYPKRVGMRFKPENLGVGELAMKVKNGSADVAADIENDFRSKGRRHIILRFLTALEENLIQNKWIGAA